MNDIYIILGFFKPFGAVISIPKIENIVENENIHSSPSYNQSEINDSENKTDTVRDKILSFY